jgi:hypothetical protein
MLDNHEFKHPFYVCSLPTNADGLIGLDFMKKTGANLDIGKGKISLAGISKGQKLVRSSPARQAALTVFTLEKEGHSPPPRQQVVKEKDGKVSESTSSWLIKSVEEMIIEPSCRQIIMGKLDTEKGDSLPPVVCGIRYGSHSRHSSRARTHTSTGKVEFTANVTSRPHSL